MRANGIIKHPIMNLPIGPISLLPLELLEEYELDLDIAEVILEPTSAKFWI